MKDIIIATIKAEIEWCKKPENKGDLSQQEVDMFIKGLEQAIFLIKSIKDELSKPTNKTAKKERELLNLYRELIGKPNPQYNHLTTKEVLVKIKELECELS